jgi:sugar/nucleoside kinase (ribokinase family)
VARFLTLGHLLVEDTILPEGTLLPGRLGGDCLYAAIGARVWADDVALVTRVGHDFPEELLEQMREAGYADGLVPCDHRTIRLWVRWGVEATGRFTFREGVGTYDDFTPEPEEIPEVLLDRLEAVHIAPVPFAPMEALVRWARPRARLLTVDPHYEHVYGNLDEWRRVLPLVDAFLPSRQEVIDLLGAWPGAEEAARALAELGARVVCIKLGAEGAFAYRAEDGASARAAAVSGELVDTTGCGDTFAGGFLVGWAETGDLRTALAYGAVSASFAAEGYGATHALRVDRAEARRRLAQLES